MPKCTFLGKRTKPETSSEDLKFDFKPYCSDQKTQGVDKQLRKYQELQSNYQHHKKCFKIVQGRPKASQRIDRCPHTEAKYYAKGMCSKCYLSYGRNRLATACEHNDRMFYALSMCLQCYHKHKHQKIKSRALHQKKMNFITDHFETAENLDILKDAVERSPKKTFSKIKTNLSSKIFPRLMEQTL